MTAYYLFFIFIFSNIRCALFVPHYDILYSFKFQRYYIVFRDLDSTRSSLAHPLVCRLKASDLLPSFLRCFPALRRATSAEDAVVGGGGGGVGGSKGATLVVNNCPFLLWYNICTRWIETRSCLLLRSPPRSIDEPFALWRQRVNKSSKGGDQSRWEGEGASDDIELLEQDT